MTITHLLLIGRSPREVFAEIEMEPVAAASIAQVHRARLHGGRVVAVKVQYPEVANQLDPDLDTLEILARYTQPR